MRIRNLRSSALRALFVTALFLLGPRPAPTSVAAVPSYRFTVKEDRLVVTDYWNAPARAGCDYASHPWPQAQLAAQRAYVLGARTVLRDEWDINSWMRQNRAAADEAHIHGAETNCFDGHLDYPAHMHIFYVVPDSAKNWQMMNVHNYINAQGKIGNQLVIPNICNQSKNLEPAAGTWIDSLDETCTPAWQQRFTSTGDIELRRGPSAPVYTLRSRNIQGDLAGVDVIRDGSFLYSIDITAYDPVAQRMVALIKDFNKRVTITETWWGDPGRGVMLAGHTVQSASMGPRPGARRGFIPFLTK